MRLVRPIITNYLVPCYFLLAFGCKQSTTPQSESAVPCDPITINYPSSINADPDPMIESGDLTIRWIGRTPKIDFVWNSDDPGSEGWPENGQTITWRAHVKNWSDTVQAEVGYQWLLGGVVVDSGRVSIFPGADTTINYVWNWLKQRSTLTFALGQDEMPGNKLTIFTDAISLALYVEQGLYNYFHSHQNSLGIGSNSFDGWAQRQIRFYNTILENAIYPETPEGVVDRVRIDNIIVVPDGALPLVPIENGFDPKQAIPNLDDRSVDLQWGFPTELIQFGTYSNHTSLGLNNAFYYSGFLMHELGHARTLVDVYGFNLFHSEDFDFVDIFENDQLIPGTKYLPGKRAIINGKEVIKVVDTIEKGMMNSQWEWMDRFSAVAMNTMQGQRATLGNFNGAESEGHFLNNLPLENILIVKDSEGYLLKNAEIEIYQSSNNSQRAGSTYPKYYNDIADIMLTTNDRAEVNLGNNPFSNDGSIIHSAWEFSNTVLILRVEHGGSVGYVPLSVVNFIMEFWKGNTDAATYEICVSLN